jgi:hypothetical protein
VLIHVEQYSSHVVSVALIIYTLSRRKYSVPTWGARPVLNTYLLVIKTSAEVVLVSLEQRDVQLVPTTLTIYKQMH